MNQLLGQKITKCKCKEPSILFALTSRVPGNVDQTVALFKEINRVFGQNVTITLLDISRGLTVYSSNNYVQKDKAYLDETLGKTSTVTIFEGHYSEKPGTRSFHIESNIETLVNSHLYSFFANDKLGSNPFMLLRRSKAQKIANEVFIKTINALSSQHFCAGITFNGRGVPDGVFSLACATVDVPVFFWEQKVAPNQIYFCTHPPQDFYSYEKELPKLQPSSEQLKRAENWLEDRVGLKDPGNSFSESWNSVPYSSTADKTEAVIFTSSQDEYWSLGEMFPKKRFDDPFSGFSKVINSLYKSEERIVLRMHPNTLNKSPSYAFRELRKIRKFKKRHNSIKVVYPHEKTNSYELIRSTNLVIVENSTIGVEAAWLGKPVIHTELSPYVGISSATLFEPSVYPANVNLDTQKIRDIAVKDIALIQSHYKMSYESEYMKGWNRRRLIASISSWWAIPLLSMRIIYPLINKILFVLAKGLGSGRNRYN